jgi:putative tryptophan/tyrosine transport system substrate-binding protein
MRRREFITLSGAAVVSWPVAVRAQQSKLPTIGFLNGSSPEKYRPYVDAFVQGLKETGYIVGQNVTMEYRWADGRYDHFPEMVADLIARHVDVIVANTPATRAAKKATNIPMVFFTGEDPVASGLVNSLNHPGGNATGVTSMYGGMATKQLGLLHDLVPTAASIAFLVNPQSPITPPNVMDAQDAARAIGVRLNVLNAGTVGEIETAFETLTRMNDGALLVQPDALFNNSSKVIALSARHAVPTLYQARDMAKAGGLMSYGPDVGDLYRLMGVYTGKVLHGTKPDELPVLQPTKFELTINLKTANALGLKISDNLQSLADEVFE